jgi:hypothetical protein
MSKHKNPWLVPMASLALLSGCAHKAPQYQDGLAPFSYARNQTVGLVSHAKRTLGPEDINTLAVAYTALEEKGNAYAGFMVESVSATSFDSARNQKYAGEFQAAIEAFDKSYGGLMATKQPMIASAWVPPFAQTLQTRWNQYSGAIARLSPQQKSDLVTTIKGQTTWPNYEDIATESVTAH